MYYWVVLNTILKFILSMFQCYNFTFIREHIHSCLLRLQLLKYSIQIYQCVTNRVLVWLHILRPYWCTYCFQIFLQYYIHINIYKRTFSLMQLLLIYTRFWYICNFYLLLI